MGFKSFQLNLKLTDVGYQKIMALDGKPVNLTEIALGKGNSAGDNGYEVHFKDDHTSLQNEVVRRQVDSHQKEGYTDDKGNQLARLDFATIFSDDSSFDVWEMGFFDDEGDLIYIWSQERKAILDDQNKVTGYEGYFAPKRTNIHLVVSVSQHLLFEEEASSVIVKDAGLPFELFLQPLKDEYNQLAKRITSLECLQISNTSMKINEIVRQWRAN